MAAIKGNGRSSFYGLKGHAAGTLLCDRITCIVSDPVRVDSQKLSLASLRRIYALSEGYTHETERLRSHKVLVRPMRSLRRTDVFPNVGVSSRFMLCAGAKKVIIRCSRRSTLLTELSALVGLWNLLIQSADWLSGAETPS